MSLSGDQYDKTSCYRSYIKYFASVEVFTFPLSINSYVCCIFMLELRHLFSSNINENLTAGVFDHNFGSLKIPQNSGSCPISFTESNYIVCPFMFDVGQTKSNSSRTGRDKAWYRVGESVWFVRLQSKRGEADKRYLKNAFTFPSVKTGPAD